MAAGEAADVIRVFVHDRQELDAGLPRPGRNHGRVEACADQDRPALVEHPEAGARFVDRHGLSRPLAAQDAREAARSVP